MRSKRKTLPALTSGLRRRLALASRVALLSDFDGTLSPIVLHPPAARLPQATRCTLRCLAKCCRVQVGIVSGRKLAELRRLVRVPGIWYVGSHGFEVCDPRGRVQVRVPASQRRQIPTVRRRLRQRLKALSGVWVESKPVSVTVHFRRASGHVARRTQRIVEEEWQQYHSWFRLQEGKKTLELLPAKNVSKVTAVLDLFSRWRHREPKNRWVILYLGDDQADEKVFARLERRAISIFVGRGKTRAHYRLASPKAVGEFLAWLAAQLGCA